MKEFKDYRQLSAAVTQASANRLGELTFDVFHTNPKGKEFLEELKRVFLERPILPTNEMVISQYGNVECYMAFRAGQSDLINLIDNSIKNTLLKQKGESKHE